MRAIPDQLQPAADHLGQKMAELEGKRREIELLWGNTDGGSVYTPSSSLSSLVPHQGVTAVDAGPELDWDVVARKNMPQEEVVPIVAQKQQVGVIFKAARDTSIFCLLKLMYLGQLPTTQVLVLITD